jgi:catechol 2,3-dioxygenase
MTTGTSFTTLPTTLATTPIDAGARIGHVHLKVADIERSLMFWRDVMGFEVQQRFGDQAAFVSAGGYHHHIALNTWQSKGGPRPARNATGLFHVAIVYPDRIALGRAVQRVVDAGVPLLGASDHGVSEAVYLDDFDGNGVELYWDRPVAEWPRTQAGELAMITEQLDVAQLLADAQVR